jgi:hypothetical protein
MIINHHVTGYDPKYCLERSEYKKGPCLDDEPEIQAGGMTAAAAFTAYHVGQSKIRSQGLPMPPSMTTGVKSSKAGNMGCHPIDVKFWRGILPKAKA